MKNYLLTVILASVSIGLCEIILPSKNGIAKYVKLIGMLVILCAVVSPIGDMLNSFDTGFLNSIKEKIDGMENQEQEYEKILYDALEKFSLSDAQKIIRESVCKKFDISDNECEVLITINNVNKINEIKILLSGKSIFKNPYEIEAYVRNTYSCECLVLIKS